MGQQPIAEMPKADRIHQRKERSPRAATVDSTVLLRNCQRKTFDTIMAGVATCRHTTAFDELRFPQPPLHQSISGFGTRAHVALSLPYVISWGSSWSAQRICGAGHKPRTSRQPGEVLCG
jgi:hypothetical protein